MKFVKSIVICLFWLLIIALMVAPLGLIFQISQDEMAEYATPTAPVLRETAVGNIAQANRQDVAVYVTVSGTFSSNSYTYQELNQQNPGMIRWIVSVGDEITEGQVLGTYKGEDVVSSVTGILLEMNTYASSGAYLRFQLFEPVELSCRVDDRTLSMLKRSDGLLTMNGETVTLMFASRQKNADGSTNIRLTIDTDKYTYGEHTDEMKITTGQVYQQAVVLPVDCVYQKDAGEDQPWYVRQVTQDGLFIMEHLVKIGYSNGDVICVTGVEVGTYYDSGYKAVMGG